jgi:amino acid transporter
MTVLQVTVAGSAVWLTFVLAGIIAGLQGYRATGLQGYRATGLQGYSFAELGAKYPSGGAILRFLSKGFGDGQLAGIGA